MYKFKNEISRPDSQNQLLIDEGLKNPLTKRLLIPGSSIKGSIRTAILDWLDENYKLDFKNNYRLIDDVLGKIQNNAFKALKLADVEIPQNMGMVVTAEEKKKNSDKQGTPKNACEVTPSMVGSLNQDFCFFSKLSLGFDENSEGTMSVVYQDTRRNISIREKFDLKRILKITTDFFKKRFDQDIENFYKKPHLNKTLSALKPVIDQVEHINTENEMLIRLGHYSHIDCVTITKNHPRLKKSKDGTFLGPNTTRTLANGVFPFGWVILAIDTKENLTNYTSRLENESHQIRANKTDTMDEIAKEKAPEKSPDQMISPLEKTIQRIRKLTDWGQIKQFATEEFKKLPSEHRTDEVKKTLIEQAGQIKYQKKKLKREPNIHQKRKAELEQLINAL